MYAPTPEVLGELTRVAATIIRGNELDSVGIYRINRNNMLDGGVVVGLPPTFKRLYEMQGIPIDPVLAETKANGWPCSTATLLGEKWRDSTLYRRVSGHFGLTGFAVFPLHDKDGRPAAILYIGTQSSCGQAHLDMEGLCRMSVHATRLVSALTKLRCRHPHLTPRQDDVAQLAARGLSNREIAEELRTGEAAVRKHMKALNQIFGTHNRTAMTAVWRQGTGFTEN